MLRKTSLLICLTALTLCLAGVAPTKADDEAVEQGEEENVVGMAGLYYDEDAGATEVEVDCWALQPTTEYFVVLFEDDDNDEDGDNDEDDDGDERVDIVLGSFTTDQDGNGYLFSIMQDSYPEGIGLKTFTFDGLHIGDPAFQSDGHGYGLTTYTFTADRLREA